MPVAKKKIKIENKLGLHLRAAVVFIKSADKFKSEITIEKDGKTANGKSIMSLMSLVASHGSYITIIAKGKDAKDAIEDLTKLIKNKFGEKE